MLNSIRINNPKSIYYLTILAGTIPYLLCNILLLIIPLLGMQTTMMALSSTYMRKRGLHLLSFLYVLSFSNAFNID